MKFPVTFEIWPKGISGEGGTLRAG
jgi:hypothetical protein